MKTERGKLADYMKYLKERHKYTSLKMQYMEEHFPPLGFEYDEDSDQVEPKSSSEFLKRIDDNCADIPDKEENLSLMKNKVLEKMKRTVRRERRLSVGGSVCSGSIRSGSGTRQRSESEEFVGELAPKVSRSSDRRSRLPAPAQHLSQ